MPLHADAARVQDQHWPGTASLLQHRGLEVAELVWGRRIYPVDHAKDVLGYRPQYGFDSFLQAFRRGDSTHYPYAHEPWWGA